MTGTSKAGKDQKPRKSLEKIKEGEQKGEKWIKYSAKTIPDAHFLSGMHLPDATLVDLGLGWRTLAVLCPIFRYAFNTQKISRNQGTPFPSGEGKGVPWFLEIFWVLKAYLKIGHSTLLRS